MTVEEVVKRIATETDKVIEEIKKKDCLLNHVIEKCPPLESLKNYTIIEYWSDSESVNVFQVVGTAHPDYNCGITWIDMLRVGRRMPINLELLKHNPHYYFDTVKKVPDMHYTKVNDRIYISGEGNHRTAIAKVLFYYTGNTMLHGIDFTEYQVDFELKYLFEELERVLYRKLPYVKAEVVRECIKREDTAGWKKDYYEVEVKLINYRNGKEFKIKCEQKDLLRKLIDEIDGLSFWKKIFKNGLVANVI